jgi:hypothetical protein
MWIGWEAREGLQGRGLAGCQCVLVRVRPLIDKLPLDLAPSVTLRCLISCQLLLQIL